MLNINSEIRILDESSLSELFEEEKDASNQAVDTDLRNSMASNYRQTEVNEEQKQLKARKKSAF